MAGAAFKLDRHRFRRVVGFAQTAVHVGSELGFRPVCLSRIYDPITTLVLNPDGTTTAWNPDRTKVLHSHSPRPGPGNTRAPTVRG